MTWLAAIAATIALVWSPSHPPLAEKPACPVVVEHIVPQGLAAQLTVRNQAPYAVRQLAIHLTFNDLARQSHEETFQDDLLVQAHQTMVFTTPPMKGNVIVWSTLYALVDCRTVRR